MSDAPKKTNPVLELPIYEGMPKFYSRFYAMPGFFWALMRIGPGIPSTFWKLTFVVWQHIIEPKKVPGASNEFAPDWTFDTTYRQLKDDYQISKTASADFTHAYDISGLFDITFGRKHRKDDEGSPTFWMYRTAATKKDWVCFIVGLSNAYKTAREQHIARSGDFRPPPRNNEEFEAHINGKIRKVYGRMGFKLHLYFAINKARAEDGLSPVGEHFFKDAIKAGLAEEGDDGLVHYSIVRTDRSRLG